MFGLPKIHNSGVPLRLVLSMLGSAHDSLAQQLVDILEPVRCNLYLYTHKDKFEFVDPIENANTQREFINSFGVKSFFQMYHEMRL